jgi:hypothetical protein
MITLLRSDASRYSISIRAELAEGIPNIMADRVANSANCRTVP